jgi:hypothetical protein
VTTGLTADEMRAIVDEHSEGEITHDWPRALATMTSAPFYEFYPYRLRVSGADAITETWKRLLPLPCFMSAEGGEFLELKEYVGTNSIIHVLDRVFADFDGTTYLSKLLVRYDFEGDRMLSETVIMDAPMLPFIDTAFDETFMAIPGVETI